MAVRKILLYSQHSALLRRKSEPVKSFSVKVKALIRDLKDTLEGSSGGIGLAAPQINIHLRVVIVCPGTVVDGNWQAGPPVAIVNPVILEASDERKDFDGCLSFPGLYGETLRPHHLSIAGINEDGKPFKEVYDGFNAVIVHHEIDHLEGVLFIDRIRDLHDLYTIRINDLGKAIREPVDAIFL